ncbi:MAG: patatin-like phospholipase family protein [Rivularia sp. (in: cyanobacteria)]|jgi:predicted acylesterase/phospholipase RssA
MVYNRPVLTFDGQDDYIDFGGDSIGDVFAQGSLAFTVSGWINPHQLTNKATSYGTRNVFFARSSDRYSDNFEFGISEEGNLDIYIDENVNKVIKTFGNGELTVREWHFFAIIFNGGQLTVYLDDGEYTGVCAGTSLNKATSVVTLGGTLHDGIYFTGQLANISLWNYPCTLAEIEKHRGGIIVGNEEGLVAYWALNEGEGTTIRDLTGNAHDGNLQGNPSWDLTQIPFAISSNQDDIENQTASSSQQDSSNQSTSELLNPKPTRKGRKSRKSSGATSSNPQFNQGETKPEQTSESEVIDNIQPIVKPEETMSTTANSKYKILAIDGGGIRGIIPAMVLAEIEKRTQKPIFELFDVIAGTSSGGILALGLTKPRLASELSDKLSVAQYTANDLLQIFVEYGAEIFYEPFFEKILGQIEDIFVQPKYSSQGREEILKQYFGDTPLENNLKEVFVTSYDIEQRIPIFFTNKSEKQQTESRKFRKLCKGLTLTDAALATSATPTYFAPHHVPTCDNPNGFYTLVDGGLYANNPSHLAVLEAQISKKKQQQVLNMDDVLLVSLGTGSLTSVYPYNDVKNWGLLQWSRPLLNMVFDGGSEVVAGELERLFESNNEQEQSSYYRFQTFLRSELEAIDNPSPENIRELQSIAKLLISEKTEEIDLLCSIL